MRKVLWIIVLLSMTSCGAPAATQIPESSNQAVVPTEASAATAPQALASPTLPAPTITHLMPSSTPSPIAGPTRTETPLPTLELPTPVANPPARQAWDGEPTYPGDSRPGYFFRVMYDPDLWASTTDNFGFPALGHRSIENCVISPSTGHGLPGNVTVDHDVRRIGTVEYEVNTVLLNGSPQFITYLGGDANVYTGFEVTFNDGPDACLSDAEVVLGTLTSVPVSQATPIP